MNTITANHQTAIDAHREAVATVQGMAELLEKSRADEERLRDADMAELLADPGKAAQLADARLRARELVTVHESMLAAAHALETTAQAAVTAEENARKHLDATAKLHAACDHLGIVRRDPHPRRGHGGGKRWRDNTMRFQEINPMSVKVSDADLDALTVIAALLGDMAADAAYTARRLELAPSAPQVRYVDRSPVEAPNDHGTNASRVLEWF